MNGGTGVGVADAHHGELLQGVFLDAEGRRCAGLVTLPLRGLGTRARFVRRPGPGVSVVPADRTKALRAAGMAVGECCHGRRVLCDGGELTLESTVPVGLGMGSSSSDVVAAIRAVAAAFGVALPAGTVARIAVRAETACDPLMLGDGRPALFAQREGRVLDVLGDALPGAVVVGCALGGGRPVDTLALAGADPEAYGEEDVRAYADLLALLRRAVREGDAGLLGRVATGSARLGQRRLRHAEFDELVEVAGRTGAVGVQIAHSGSVAGLLFDPAADGGPERRVRGCLRALAGLGIPVTRIFRTDDGGRGHGAPEEWERHGRAHSGRGRQARSGAAGGRARLPAL
ncbi:GHMP kinase [Streptomyces sp. NPDC050504]|uniref:GHMP family kinase ATP-binding protein n=1 Tax=Streptomyces sp. NPDC050504 TaxID=3365618 RepID=UPI0037A1D49B